MVKFLNLVPWAGLYFCAKPNEIIDLPEDTAIDREKLGLGRMIVDKSKPLPPEPKAEKPAAKPKATKVAKES
jgi:hypothetical protein